MATRFGGSRPSQISNVRKNWIVGLLGSVCIVLLGSIVVLLRSSGTGEAAVGTKNQQNTIDNVPMPENVAMVLVARQRIEEGSPLSPTLFEEERIPVEKKPMDAFDANQKAALLGMYSNRLIVPNTPLTREDITEKSPIGVTGLIPPGHRAVTIDVTKTTSVEGFTRPNTRVDVLYAFTDRDGQRKVATIVRFAKILSYGGVTANTGTNNRTEGAAKTVTVLVTERDAQRIELAKTTGQLSLVLVGDNEPGRVTSEPSVVTLDTIIGAAPTDAIKKNPVAGRMMVTDPKTGQKVSYCLRGGNWETSCEE